MKNLESSKSFPYIAWITIILFSLITYELVQNLNTELNRLEERTEHTTSSLQNS